MVNLEIYAVRNGSYPEDLDALVPTILSEAPRDIFGQPYGYRLLDNDPDGRPYLLYFIGLDGIDGGGADASPAAIDEHGWQAIFVPGVRGDLILNRARAKKW